MKTNEIPANLITRKNYDPIFIFSTILSWICVIPFSILSMIISILFLVLFMLTVLNQGDWYYSRMKFYKFWSLFSFGLRHFEDSRSLYDQIQAVKMENLGETLTLKLVWSHFDEVTFVSHKWRGDDPCSEEVLDELRNLGIEGQLFWIDFLCVNQSDDLKFDYILEVMTKLRMFKQVYVCKIQESEYRTSPWCLFEYLYRNESGIREEMSLTLKPFRKLRDAILIHRAVNHSLKSGQTSIHFENYGYMIYLIALIENNFIRVSMIGDALNTQFEVELINGEICIVKQTKESMRTFLTKYVQSKAMVGLVGDSC